MKHDQKKNSSGKHPLVKKCWLLIFIKNTVTKRQICRREKNITMPKLEKINFEEKGALTEKLRLIGALGSILWMPRLYQERIPDLFSLELASLIIS